MRYIPKKQMLKYPCYKRNSMKLLVLNTQDAMQRCSAKMRKIIIICGDETMIVLELALY